MILATNNKGKLEEIRKILTDYKIYSLKDKNINVDVEEDKDTFVDNAIKKATEISTYLNGKKCMSDDSGIEIPYLDGFPGVFTKRWHAGTDRDRNMEIIRKLEGVSKENRKVIFTTAIALAEGDKLLTAEEKIEGYISEEPRGKNGFGFDEIFELENGKTLAELSQEEKNEIEEYLKELNVLELTPIQAINTLYELKNKTLIK